VLASDGFLIVETRGARLRLKPGRDGYTQVVERSANERRIGTRIEIGFGPDLPADANALSWAHLAIHLAQGNAYAGKSSPWWYDLPQFHELLSASGGVPVRALIESLDGCAGGRAGEIVAQAGLSRMACPDLDSAQAARLLATAREAAKPVSPKRLGAVGPAAFPDRAYAIAYGSAPFGSRLRADIPVAVEVWASQAKENSVAASVNRTPIAGEMALQRDKSEVNLFGCGLRHTVAKAPKELKFNVWLNITAPYMPITSDGKEPDLRPFLAIIDEAMTKAIRKVRRPGAGVVSQKDVALDHLEEVIETVSGGALRYRFNARQLFYALRPIVMEETGKELKISNFTDIIDDYEKENGEIRAQPTGDDHV
jgi:hypothetical protein